MNADQEIERLDQLLRQLHENYPNTFATLRINNMTFRACTADRWDSHNWAVRDEEAGAIMNGNEEQRRKALLSLLLPQYINKIEFVPGVDTIEVIVPEQATVDQV